MCNVEKKKEKENRRKITVTLQFTVIIRVIFKTILLNVSISFFLVLSKYSQHVPCRAIRYSPHQTTGVDHYIFMVTLISVYFI